MNLIKSKDIHKRDIGIPKKQALIHQVDISSSTVHEVLDKILSYFRSNKGTGSFTIFFNSGGIGGSEFEETQKISSSK